MSTEEAFETFDQAVEILAEAGDNVSPTHIRNAMSLLLMAVKKAGGVFPQANGLLAELYLMTGDYNFATKYADLALSQDPDLLETQYIKVGIAFNNLDSMYGGIVGIFSERAKQRKLNDEITRYVSLYDRLCATGMEATKFIYRSTALIGVADRLSQSKNSLSKKINIYSHVANAPIVNLSYESEGEREEVKKIRHLAEGRMSL